METFGVENEQGETVLIESNDYNVCLDCNHIVTEFNDSGWEAFTEASGGTKTQKLCEPCFAKRENEFSGEKAHE